MVNNAALELIKRFEGCRLQAYLCPANVLTIGYGHTDNVEIGLMITQKEADTLLMSDLSRFETAVAGMVRVKLTQNQTEALVSLAYNIGKVALKNSTLMQRLNNGDYQGAANAFGMWNKGTIKGVKQELKGLTARRKAEKELFLS